MILCPPTGEIGKLLGARWKELDDDEKRPYLEQAERDKERAEREKREYDVSFSSFSSYDAYTDTL